VKAAPSVGIWARASQLTLVAALAFSGAAPAGAADEGQAAFNNYCRTCHSTVAHDNRLGPSLHQIFGARAGTVSGYTGYSRGLSSSGITWDEATLDAFIANPDSVVPNNNMKPFNGIRDDAVRARIIAFLKAQRG
jgi:cytochrome c